MEIIPLICTSVIWGQYPVFCHPVLPLGSLLGVAAVWPCCWEGLRVGGGGATEDEMVVWHHQLNGYEFEQTLGDREGQETLAYCSPWGRNESDMTERLNSNNILQGFLFVCLFPSCVPKGLTSSLTQREVAAIIDDSDILSLLVWEAVFYFSTVKVLIMRKMFCNCVG